MGNVFVIAEQKDGNIKRVSLEILSELNRQGVAPTAVVPGFGNLSAVTDSLVNHGAAKVVVLEHEVLAQYNTEAYANALHKYLSTQSPSVILTGATSHGKPSGTLGAKTCHFILTPASGSGKSWGVTLTGRANAGSGNRPGHDRLPRQRRNTCGSRWSRGRALRTERI